jgi:hypothetical protein
MNWQFLSMKLATVNPELGFDIEQILSKQVNPPLIIMSVSACYFKSALIQSIFLFAGVAFTRQSYCVLWNRPRINQPEMLCSVSNPVDVLQRTIHDVIISHLETC